MDEFTNEISCPECNGIGEFDCLDDCAGWCTECNGGLMTCLLCKGKCYVNGPVDMISDRTGDLTLDNAIESFLDFAESEGYGTKEGAVDMCNHACDEFLHKLTEIGIEGEIEHYDSGLISDVEEDYPYCLCNCWHWAVRIGDWIIDWTARQFDESAKFPAVWKSERKEGNS